MDVQVNDIVDVLFKLLDGCCPIKIVVAIMTIV